MKQNSKLLLYLPLAKQQSLGGAAAAVSCLISLHLQGFIHQPQLVLFFFSLIAHTAILLQKTNKKKPQKTNKQKTKYIKTKTRTRSAQHTKFGI